MAPPFTGLTPLEVAGARARFHVPAPGEVRSTGIRPAGRMPPPPRSHPCVLLAPAGPEDVGLSALRPLLERRLAVLVLEAEPSPEVASRVAVWLRGRPECRDWPLGMLVSGDSPERQASIARAIRPRALAMMVAPSSGRLDDSPDTGRRQGSVDKLLLLAATSDGSRDASLVSRVAAGVGRVPVERWYPPVRGRLPPEAGPAAAAWLAGELEAD